MDIRVAVDRFLREADERIEALYIFGCFALGSLPSLLRLVIRPGWQREGRRTASAGHQSWALEAWLFD